jgi:hypothetical protein
MEFPFNVKTILPIGVDVRVARRREMHHIGIIDVMAFGSRLAVVVSESASHILYARLLGWPS